MRDVFLALVSGATLCLPEDKIERDAEATLKWLRNAKISIVHTVPTLAQMWLGSHAETSLLDLSRVFFAGEPLKDALVHQWREHFPHCQIVNLYGPTETTMAKCFYAVPEQIFPGIQPVGCPLPQTQALVINKVGQLCGIGEPGEIVLRTPFRTLGYINAPEDNSRKFVKIRSAKMNRIWCITPVIRDVIDLMVSLIFSVALMIKSRYAGIASS